MKSVTAAFLLALAGVAPAQAATCPQEARLRADPRWAPVDDETCHHCLVNIVFVGPDGLLFWNGGPVTEARLATYLGRVARMEWRPVTLLAIHDRVAGADCALLARVVAAIETQVDCRGGDRCDFGLWTDRQRPPPR